MNNCTDTSAPWPGSGGPKRSRRGRRRAPPRRPPQDPAGLDQKTIRVVGEAEDDHHEYSPKGPVSERQPLAEPPATRIPRPGGIDPEANLQGPGGPAAADRHLHPEVTGERVAAGVALFASLEQAGIPLQESYRIALDLACTGVHGELQWLVADALMHCSSITFERPVIGPVELPRALS